MGWTESMCHNLQAGSARASSDSGSSSSKTGKVIGFYLLFGEVSEYNLPQMKHKGINMDT